MPRFRCRIHLVAAALPLIVSAAPAPDGAASSEKRWIVQELPRTLPAPAEVVIDRPVYHCLRTRRPVRVDGVLNEPIWRAVAPTRPFRLWDGKGRPSGKTQVKACWDARHLYLAFQCEDRDIHSPYTRRDEPLYAGEVVEAFLAPGADPRSYVELEVSPANVIFDARVMNTRPRGKIAVERSWNAPGLRTAVRVNGTLNRREDRDREWTVEIALPLAAMDLDRPVRAGDTWRVNFYRIDRGRPDEYAAWSPTVTPTPDFHVPSRFGKLVFEGTAK